MVYFFPSSYFFAFAFFFLFLSLYFPLSLSLILRLPVCFYLAPKQQRPPLPQQQQQQLAASRTCAITLQDVADDFERTSAAVVARSRTRTSFRWRSLARSSLATLAKLHKTLTAANLKPFVQKLTGGSEQNLARLECEIHWLRRRRRPIKRAEKSSSANIRSKRTEEKGERKRKKKHSALKLDDDDEQQVACICRRRRRSSGEQPNDQQKERATHERGQFGPFAGFMLISSAGPKGRRVQRRPSLPTPDASDYFWLSGAFFAVSALGCFFLQSTTTTGAADRRERREYHQLKAHWLL